MRRERGGGHCHTGCANTPNQHDNSEELVCDGGITANKCLATRLVFKVVNESYVVRGCLVCTHKAVSSGFAGLSVCYHHSLVNVPKGLEVFSQRGVVRVVRQPADEDFGKSSVFLKRCGMHDFQGSVHELMQKHWSAGEKTRGTLKIY